ncbi:hypothetical protein C2G38_2192489 [Gigaspora rosea]|uniref:Uncharacterized protein n=1 Tax=Gigaspora rosea TaxID=44941 RepID=A0A397V0I8_9GLOM|nr:hypothetical protein C2G38_2192489 [Gigaspora rosea]
MIYPPTYKLNETEFRAWRAMLHACGCTNIIPYPKSKTKKEFWSRLTDPTVNKANLKLLYELGYLNIDSEDSENPEDSENSEDLDSIEGILWSSFRNALMSNKRGHNKKARILSIIADQFTYKLLEKSSDYSHAIELVRKHSRLYGPGAPQIKGPKKSIQKMTEIKKMQFLAFFQNKNNIAQSSYQVDAKTSISILYMQDQKEALWTKFNKTYPNGMRRTSFMTHLANCSHIRYREDLGGLCIICNEYRFEVFEDLLALVRQIFTRETLDPIISQIENLRRYLKRNFERHLKVELDGKPSHNNCINYCLPFVFGECLSPHYSRCQEWSEFPIFFDFIKKNSNDKYHSQLLEMQEKLKYFLAHHARKYYLNEQYKTSLVGLDSEGAIMITDYKMRVLPKMARETKQEFFEDVDSIEGDDIVENRVENVSVEDDSIENSSVGLNVSAYDHWSTDMKQDTWFTASCFEAVFNNIDKKPKWIKVRGWLFLELGEAKIQLIHIMQHTCYQKICSCQIDLVEGSDIIAATKNLAETYLANIEPNRNQKANESENLTTKNKGKKLRVETIAGISKASVHFFPAMITNLCNEELSRPEPKLSTHTKPKSKWKMALSKFQENKNPNTMKTDDIEMIDITKDDDTEEVDFPWNKGWALRENAAYGNQGAGKRMTDTVKKMLEQMYLLGNVHAKYRMTAKEMHDRLKKFADNGELEQDEIPKVSTI